jgi:membrane-bound metal-dependent hydrolase YbcI (DUF457 family)
LTWLTHTTFAYLTACLLGLPPAPAILGSTAPDWSEDLLGVKEHRGRTHYITYWSFLFLLTLVLYLGAPNGPAKTLFLNLLTFAFGGLTHLFLDSLTVAGVPLGLSRTRIRIGGLITTGKLSEWIFLGLILLILIPVKNAGLTLGLTNYKELLKRGVIDKREYKEHRWDLL